MKIDRIFVDTNILVFSTNGLSPYDSVALKILNYLLKNDVELVVSTQVLREYISICTRHDSFISQVSVADVVYNVNSFLDRFSVVEDNFLVFSMLIEFAKKYKFGGKQIHDANIVATIAVHGMKNLFTHNVADFKKFDDLIDIYTLEDLA